MILSPVLSQWEHGHWLGVFEKNYGYPHAIELTPEWLERFGFRRVDATLALDVQGIKGPYYAKDALLLWSNGSEPKSAYLVYYATGIMGKHYAVPGRWIYSVHDLQNTYHSWKGEELAIDKTSLI